MRPDGNELIALWREVGEWWAGEPSREVVRYVDERGIRRETVRELPPVLPLGDGSAPKPYVENNSEEVSLRIRKVRDEKVAKATGAAPIDPTQAAIEAEVEASLRFGSDREATYADSRYTESLHQVRERRYYGSYADVYGASGDEANGKGALASAETSYDLKSQISNLKSKVQPGKPVSTPIAERPTSENHVLKSRGESPPTPSPHLNLKSQISDLRSGMKNPQSEIRNPQSAIPYVPLHVLSGYAFGRGTMLAEEIPVLAARFGLPAVAIADPHSLVGAVEFARRSNAAGIKPLIGAEIELPCGGRIVLIARSKRGYVSLSQLISECHLGEPRLYPLGSWERLERFSRDLICLTGGDDGPIDRALLKGQTGDASKTLDRLVGLYGRENVFVEIERSYLPWQRLTESRLLELADRQGVLPVAGGPITHARPAHFPAQDILACVETLCTVEEVLGRKPSRDPSQPGVEPRPGRALNAERFLRLPNEMAGLFADAPELLENTRRVADRCDDDVLPGRTQLPEFCADPGRMLREVTYIGAYERHGPLSPKRRKRIDHELDRIVRLDFAGHFLTIWDACRWAKEQGIQLSGRGSVVDCAVAYCLGISRIDAFEHRLHFDRFLPDDGSKRPDIDIDFEAKRRDDVRNYLTRKYGVERVATVAAVGAYCTRGIVREVGKALGLPTELIGFLSKRLHGGVTPDQLESALEKRPELMQSGIPKERFRWVFELAERLMDVPRNIRAHSSGVVISSRPLCETVPVMWSASEVGDAREMDRASEPIRNPQSEIRNLRIIQWDKRSAKYYFDKFDILCLRGQDVLSGVERRLTSQSGHCHPERSEGSPHQRRHCVKEEILRSAQDDKSTFRVDAIPLDDEEAYRAMRSGELIGIPQSASPAMRQAHIRLRTQDLHDASLVQAGIRPGVGGAVKINELIARRRGKPYSFDHPDFEQILGLTYGIIVFQEQVDQLLQTFGGYSSGEAEELRESIHKRRREDYGRMMKEQILARIVSNGYTESVAEQVYDYVAGFKGYGFAQGHALAFAEISIRSIYCQQNFPAEYFASLLDAQPAGYYGPCTLVNEARSRGVMMRRPDVNLSAKSFQVEDVLSPMDPKIVLPNAAIRVGWMQVHGLSEETAQRISDCGLRIADFEVRDRMPHWTDRTYSTNWTNPSNRSNASNPTADALTLENPQSAIRNPKFRSFFHFVTEVRPSRDELEALILCGALDSLCPNRRAMLWAIPSAQDYAESSIGENALGLDLPEPELNLSIPDFSEIEKAILERKYLGLDVDRHLMAFERERIAAKGGIPAAEAKRLPNRKKAIVVGNPIRLRFPPTPSGKRVVFFDLEDETGLLNVTCFDAVYRRDGHAIVCSPYVTLIGEGQDRDGHTAFLAKRVFPYHPVIAKATGKAELPIGTADFLCG